MARTISNVLTNANVTFRHLEFYKTMASTSTAPSTTQQIALPRSPANQNPLAALKQRIALDDPLAHAAGLHNVFSNFIAISYPNSHDALAAL